MLRLAIVEDEQNCIDQLKSYIDRYRREKRTDISVDIFFDGDEIVEQYAGQYDIILMDIQMRFMDGMTAAEEIRKADRNVVIIFITNMYQYAVKGYQVDALDYIVKPVEYYSFSQKLDRAVSRIAWNHSTSFIAVYTRGGIYKVDTSRILYIESEGHNLHFYIAEQERTDQEPAVQELIARMKIGDVERELEPYGFYRCGKGFIVNLEKVDSYVDGVCFIGNHAIPVSRAKKKEFMNVMSAFMSKRLL